MKINCSFTHAVCNTVAAIAILAYAMIILYFIPEKEIIAFKHYIDAIPLIAIRCIGIMAIAYPIAWMIPVSEIKSEMVGKEMKSVRMIEVSRRRKYAQLQLKMRS